MLVSATMVAAVAAATAAFEAFQAEDAARELAPLQEADAAQDLLDYDSQDGASLSGGEEHEPHPHDHHVDDEEAAPHASPTSYYLPLIHT